MRIELGVIVDNVAVIVGVSDAHLAVLEHLDVVVAVADVKVLDSSVGLHYPAQSSVFFVGGERAFLDE